MIDLAEARRSLSGVGRLLVGDPRGLALLDLTIDGFWRSFAVAVWMLPIVVVSVAADVRLLTEAGVDPAAIEPMARFVVGLLTYFLGWAAFPLLLVVVARPLGLGGVFVPWMVARNWSTPVAAVPFVLVTALWLLGIAPDSALAPGTLTSLIFGLYCGFRVARIAGLQAPFASVGWALLDFLASLVVEVGLDRLIGL